MKWLLLILGSAALLWSLPCSSSARAEILLQTTGRLENGDERLNDGSFYDTHTFNGRLGQHVTIQLTSSSFDTYLILVDERGHKIAENDDASANSLNSRLTVTLPEDGTYRIIANGIDSSAIGNYYLLLSSETGAGSTATTASAAREADARPGYALHVVPSVFSIEYPEGWLIQDSTQDFVSIWNKPPSRDWMFPSGFVKTEVYISSRTFGETLQSLLNSSNDSPGPGVLTRKGELTIGGREAFRVWFEGGDHTEDSIVTIVRYSNNRTATIASHFTGGETWAIPAIQDMHWSFRVR